MDLGFEVPEVSCSACAPPGHLGREPFRIEHYPSQAGTSTPRQRRHQDRAVVNVGVTPDTAEFAVESVRRWWRLLGKRTYPHAARLLICADAGGGNGNRLRAWKLHLQ